jgi:hypothetical protein
MYGFYAGHGMEIGGENWLIPIDAELRTDTDAENEAVSLRSVMLQVASANQLGLVILDACRNNPFAARMRRRAPPATRPCANTPMSPGSFSRPGVLPDNRRITRWPANCYEKAIGLGSALAMSNLGVLYQTGRVSPKTRSKHASGTRKRPPTETKWRRTI